MQGIIGSYVHLALLHTHFYTIDLKLASAIRFLFIAIMHLIIDIMMVLIVIAITLYLNFTIVNNKLKQC